ncbi:MAG: hypothetical protein U0T32_00585 [Chitinophagales bacterium]
MVLLVYNAPSGIDAAQLSNTIVVYPNPTSGIVTITSDERSTIHVACFRPTYFSRHKS